MSRLVILAAAIAAACLMPRSASAARYYPWCAWYDAWTYDCGYTTLQQCLETISGVGGGCKPNPYPAPAPPRSRRRY